MTRMYPIRRRLCAALLASIISVGAAYIFASPLPPQGQTYTIQDIWQEDVQFLTVETRGGPGETGHIIHVYEDPALIRAVYDLMDDMEFVEDTRRTFPLTILHVIWEGNPRFQPNYGPSSGDIHIALNWTGSELDIGLPIGAMENGTACMRFGEDYRNTIRLVPQEGDVAALLAALQKLQFANEEKNIYHT